MVPNREAAMGNIQAAIARRGDQFFLLDLQRTAEGYKATFAQGQVTTVRTIDEGTAEDRAPADQPATRALAAILDDVRVEFTGRRR